MDHENDLENWFKSQQEILAIDVKEIALADGQDWVITQEDGRPHHIGHKTGKYHRGVLLKAWDNVRQAWIERFLLAPIPPEGVEKFYGVTLIARYNDRYLVQAKAEPGNPTPGHVQLTSTIQASYTNIMAQLSGSIPFTWMYKNERCIQLISSQDGAQLYLKNNKVSFLELAEEPKEIPENFAWATAAEIKSFAQRGLEIGRAHV